MNVGGEIKGASLVGVKEWTWSNETSQDFKTDYGPIEGYMIRVQPLEIVATRRLVTTISRFYHFPGMPCRGDYNDIIWVEPSSSEKKYNDEILVDTKWWICEAKCPCTEK